MKENNEIADILVSRGSEADLIYPKPIKVKQNYSNSEVRKWFFDKHIEAQYYW